MTLAAWIMLTVTWTLIIGFTARFLWLAARQGPRKDDS